MTIVPPVPLVSADVGQARRSDRVASVPPNPGLRARVRKRSISIAGHATSVSLEDPFWEALRAIAAARGCSVADLVRRVDASRSAQAHEAGPGAPPVNLSSALRVFVLDVVRGGEGGEPRDR